MNNAILGLLAETSIHAGSGQSVGGVDLPIQREGHNNWPCVFGSAVKGALRARAEDIKMPDIDIAFGPRPASGQASDHAGALAVGDARLLLLPVRSLTGYFKWVTCPAALTRLKRDAFRLGLDIAMPDSPDVPADDTAIVPDGAASGGMFLEEYRFNAIPQNLADVITSLAKLMKGEDSTERLTCQLVIVSDDQFSFFAQYATPVAAHVRIDNGKKTVAKGALWYEETLPPETLMYVGLGAFPSRRNGSAISGKEILDSTVQSLFGAHPYLQLGGNETVGMGWCRVAVNRTSIVPSGGQVAVTESQAVVAAQEV
ncbi:MAG: type III-B CRISPR module RAMP protein Cmr4 [Nitrospirae bacterium]|nr:type III-B CRISPR module RAMP protein Cmr4 [Nitrospirota bacterium]